MSHQKSETIEVGGKHYVINTAGFRSLKAAVNAAFNKKNLKHVPPKAYASEKAATAASKRRSAKTDKIRQRNSMMQSGDVKFYRGF